MLVFRKHAAVGALMRPAFLVLAMLPVTALLVAGAARERSALGVRSPSALRNAGSSTARMPVPSSARALLERLPVAFEPNVGQTDRQVRFISRTRTGTLFISPTEATLTLSAPAEPARPRARRVGRGSERATVPAAGARRVVDLRMKLVDPRVAPAVLGAEKLPGIVSYFQGSDPGAWKTRVPTYAKVRCQEAYPGIDLVYYGREGRLEYDFVVAPGADPGRIGLSLEGADAVTLDERGDLVLSTALGEVRHHAPVAYQEIDGTRRGISSRFVLGSAQPEGEVGHAAIHTRRQRPAASHSLVRFELGAYDRARPLVIDPTLTYSTYLGGNSNEVAFGLTVDAQGAVYMTGRTSSLDFPVGPNPGRPIDPDGEFFSDAFVTKINPAGTAQEYTTFFAAQSQGNDVAVNSQGVAFVTGVTGSIHFPTTPGAFQQNLVAVGRRPNDAFVAAIAADGGSLLYSTYLGGTGGESGMGIAVDANGQACVTGQTSSPTAGIPGNFPVKNAAQPGQGGGGTDTPDAFVTKFNAAGSRLVFSTYLGGSGFERAFGTLQLSRAAVDAAGNIYVAGSTESPDFPLLNAADATFAGGREAYVAKYTPAGARVYATFLGGSALDSGGAIGVDSAGSAYVTGDTQSIDFPVLNALQPTYAGGSGGGDAFVTRLTPSGGLVFSTYLGGQGVDEGTGIAVDSGGRIYLCGKTASEDFPLVAPLPGMTAGGPYLARLAPGGDRLLFSSYFAGNFGRTTDVYDVAAGPRGSLIACGVTNNELDFPVSNALQPLHGGGFEDTFLVRVDPAAPVVSLTSPAANATVTNPVAIRAGITADTRVTWQVLVDGQPNTAGTGSGPAAVVVDATLAAGAHTVEVRATDEDGQIASSGVRSFTVEINRAPTANAGLDRTLKTKAAKAKVTLDGSGSSDPDKDTLTFIWREGKTEIATGVKPTVRLKKGVHTITLEVRDPDGLSDTDEVVITVKKKKRR